MNVPNYMKRTAARPNALGLNGQTYYVADILSAGNNKLADTVLIFDIPAVETCPICADCKNACYALRDQNQYPNCYTRRSLHYQGLLYNPSRMRELIVNQLRESEQPYVRIHSSGDFFAQWYVDFWADIVRQFPEKTFYCYTKADSIFEFNALEALPNINIVRSLVNGHINFGSIEYIKGLRREHGGAICPYGISKKVVHCGSECTKCMHHEFVYFLQH